MRWQPDSPACAECGFDWQLAGRDAIDLVAQVPDAATAAIARIHDPTQRTGEAWSASMYLWHLVDVLRIGTERLLTLTHDPSRGITCWDENALAEVRHYQRLSPVVGLIVLRSAAQAWATTAAAAPADVQVRHPQFGTLGHWRSFAAMPMRSTTICWISTAPTRRGSTGGATASCCSEVAAHR